MLSTSHHMLMQTISRLSPACHCPRPSGAPASVPGQGDCGSLPRLDRLTTTRKLAVSSQLAVGLDGRLASDRHAPQVSGGCIAAVLELVAPGGLAVVLVEVSSRDRGPCFRACQAFFCQDSAWTSYGAGANSRSHSSGSSFVNTANCSSRTAPQ